MNPEQRRKLKDKHLREFRAIANAFEMAGRSMYWVSAEIGGEPRILPESRITKLRRGDTRQCHFPNTEQMAAIIGLARREGIKWQTPKPHV